MGEKYHAEKVRKGVPEEVALRQLQRDLRAGEMAQRANDLARHHGDPSSHVIVKWRTSVQSATVVEMGGSPEATSQSR